MRFQPLQDKILVQPITAPKRTAGGLHIPETARGDQNAQRGRVVAVGMGRVLDNGDQLDPIVDIDDEVYFIPGKLEIEFEGEKYIVLQERDLLGVVIE